MTTIGRGQRDALCEHFLGWQCRIRQMALRQDGGRPTPGMRPAVRLAGGQVVPAINVLILRLEPHESTARFRHIVKHTEDPRQRYEEAVRELAGAYYQRSYEFSERMTALFAADSELAARLVQAGRCELAFEQFSQRYDLPCVVAEVAANDPVFEATYWHNHMFNPALPGSVRVLGFAPDWAAARADPPVPPAP